MHYIQNLENETYIEYINRILNLRDNIKIDGEYMERHHIIPKSCGGSNETQNLIYLFPEEHYIAHGLLALNNPENTKAALAWGYMNKLHNFQSIDNNNVEEYGKLRRLFSQAIKQSNHTRVCSDATRKKMSDAKKGKPGHPISQGTKEKLRQINIGRKHTQETKDKISKLNKGHISWNKGKLWTEEQKQEFSQKRKGSNNPMYGKQHSKATRQKMADIQKIMVHCITTNEFFLSAIEAGQKYNTNPHNIRNCCRGKTKTCLNMQWEYVKDYNSQES